MSLMLVRHGQASFGQANYDVLSERGHLQAQRLGQWLAQHGNAFEHVWVGRMQRQQDTYAAIQNAFAQADKPTPLATVSPYFDEFDHQAVFTAFKTQHAEHPSIEAAQQGGTQAIGELIYHALLAWCTNKLEDVPETWQQFGERAQQAADLCWAQRDQSQLVVSSGGLISRIAQRALDMPDVRAIELNISLRNSAMVELHWRKDAWRLSCWNAMPHLAEQRHLWTYF